MKFLKIFFIFMYFLFSSQNIFAFFNFKSTYYRGTEVVEEEEKTEARSPVDVPIPQDECCNKHQKQEGAFGISPQESRSIVSQWLQTKTELDSEAPTDNTTFYEGEDKGTGEGEAASGLR